MKKLSLVVISLTLSSTLLTGCGKKVNAIAQPLPVQQVVQPVSQSNPYANPAYQQNPQLSQNQDYYTPNSPDVSSPAYNNAQNSTNNGQYQNVSNQNYNNTTATPTVQPTVAPATTPAPEVKVPWYKKVVEKVKAIFKKKS